MIYTHENCMPKTKVCNSFGSTIARVCWVDVDRAVIGVVDSPIRLNADRTEVIGHEIAYKRIKIEERDSRSGLPSKFRCYRRLS